MSLIWDQLRALAIGLGIGFVIGFMVGCTLAVIAGVFK